MPIVGSILQNRPNTQQDRRRRYENEMAWGLLTQRRFFGKYSCHNSCQILSFPLFFHVFNFSILVILGTRVGNIRILPIVGSILQNRLNIQQDRRRRYENEMAWGLQTQTRFFFIYSFIDSCQILSFPFFHFVILVILGARVGNITNRSNGWVIFTKTAQYPTGSKETQRK